MVLRFPEVEKMTSSVLQLDEVQFEYTPGNPLFLNVNLSVAMDSRICIVSVVVTYSRSFSILHYSFSFALVIIPVMCVCFYNY